jgi:hypothetical protein
MPKTSGKVIRQDDPISSKKQLRQIAERVLSKQMHLIEK